MVDQIAMNPIKILYFDTMWGWPLDTPKGGVSGFEFSTDRTTFDNADVVIFHIPQLKRWRRFWMPKKQPHQIWVAWSMESEENYPELKSDRFMANFDLSIGYKQDSDVPCAYLNYSPDPKVIDKELRAPAPAKEAGRLVAAFISSKFNRSGRLEYLSELSRHIQVDSYGTQLRNQVIAEDLGRRSKHEIISKYKFTLAFENSVCVDYVTEKFYDPLFSGSVPVYLGAPNVSDFAPGEQCFIDTADFGSPKDLADYLRYLDQNESEYQQYFAWKQRPFTPNFERILDSLRTTSGEKLCEVLRTIKRPGIPALQKAVGN